MEKSESLDHIQTWPVIENAGQLERWINESTSASTRSSRAVEAVNALDLQWPHHGEFFRIVGRCYVPENPDDPYDLQWVGEREVEGLSLGFLALAEESQPVEMGLLLRTHLSLVNVPQKNAVVYANSFVSLREPFTVLEHESDVISAISPERISSQRPDEHFSFRRYGAIGHRFIYGETAMAPEERKRKALDYIRQRWPYGECEMSVSAEYAYQLNWGELFYVDKMHLFSRRQPIRGTLLDFGFYPHRLTSDGAITRGSTKFGVDTLSLIIEPEEPERYFLRRNGVLVIPTSQRLSAVVHDYDQDIVIK